MRDPSHEQGLLEQKPRSRSGALPPALAALGQVGVDYFRILAAGSRSIQREIVRLTLLAELFGEAAVTSAVAEVMSTGHVGAEYVEYILRHKRALTPNPPALHLGDAALDDICLREPDLGVYDQLVSPCITRDPGPGSDDPF